MGFHMVNTIVKYALLFVLILLVLMSIDRSAIKNYIDMCLPFVSSYIPIEHYVLNKNSYIKRSEELVGQYTTTGENAGCIFTGDSHIYKLTEFQNKIGNIINLGISGDTTVGLIKRLNRNDWNIRADIVVVLIGFNDLKFRSNLDIQKNIDEIILVLQKTFSVDESKIVLLSLLPVNHSRVYLNRKIEQLNQYMKDLSINTPVVFLNVYNLFINDDKVSVSAYFQADGVHLNELGNKKLSSLLKEQLNKRCMDHDS